MGIEAIALDCYGTILASNDPDNELPPRKGLKKFIRKCLDRGIRIYIASDASPANVRIDLEESLAKIGLDLSWISKIYQLDQYPCKDFTVITSEQKILPENLLVIGDSDKDIKGAIKCRACYLRVPEYWDTPDSFDMAKINF